MIGVTVTDKPRGGWNPLQALLAGAMREQGHPVEERGGQAWLARQAKIPFQLVSFIFTRPDYVPLPPTRDKLARALHISPREIDEAADAVKGWRVYAGDANEPLNLLDRLDMILAAEDLTDAERDEIAARLEEIWDERLSED